MMGPALVLVGLVVGIVGWALLRRSGNSWRIGRLLAAAPQRGLADAAAQAARGDAAYVRLHGRIDSDEEFPGDDDKPLVFRRRRLLRQVRRWPGRGGWQTFDDERLAVPFRLSERGEQVSVDAAALGDGLVVVPRVSLGMAADLSPEATVGAVPPLAPGTPVMLRLEQVSSVDHGTACGVPRLGPAGETVLGPGLGRPLILTTLAVDEAMRVLGADRRASLLVAGALLVAAPLSVGAGLLITLAGP
jgi:hypothetical protein